MNALLKSIRKAKTPKEIFEIYLQNMPAYEPKHYLESLTKINQLKDFNFMVMYNLQANFVNRMCKLQITDNDEIWKFYVEASKIKKFHKVTKIMAEKILDNKQFFNINQLSKFLWCMAKSEIDLSEKLTLIVQHLEKLITNPNQQKSKDDPFQLKQLDYTQKDLNLIVWSLSSMNVKSQILVNKIDTNHMDLQSLIIFIYSLLKYQQHEKIHQILDQIEQNKIDDLKAQNVMTLKLLIQTMGQVQSQNQELAIKVVKEIIKKQDKYNLSAKFVTQLNWGLFRMNIHDKNIFNILVIESENAIVYMNEIDLAQNLNVYSYLCKRYPEQQRYEQFLRKICVRILERKHTLKNRSLSMIQEVAKEYQLKKLEEL